MHTHTGAYVFQVSCLASPASGSEGEIAPLPLEALKALAPSAGEVWEIPDPSGEKRILTVDLPEDFPLPSGWRKIPLREAVSRLSQGIPAPGGPPGPLMRAYHIVQWRRESRFCGSCGSPNGDARRELARQCPVCGRLEYPRITPAIIVIILNDQGQALLAHNKQFPQGMYSLIAGFNEAGETLEGTLIREVREEVGLEVRDIQYVTSQPWPFPYSLMLGFRARHSGGSIRVDGEEIEDARWFDRDQTPDLPGRGSVSRYLINQWLSGTF